MTAEIALMNRSAVALAADSAVTIQTERKLKIYNTHKIFTLSKYHPVGVMVYGSASLTGIPWEPIIKTYRKALGKKSFGSLTKYVEDFLNFLDDNNSLFEDTEQKAKFEAWSAYYLNVSIRGPIDEKVKRVDDTGSRIGDKQLRTIIQECIQSEYDHISRHKLLPHLDADFLQTLAKGYRPLIDAAIKRVFQNLPLTRTQKVKLRTICVGLFAKDHWINPDRSGIVIAGFGNEDIFPKLQNAVIGGIASGRLKYELNEPRIISSENGAEIVAFAQREMVVSFMEGIDPSFQQTLQAYLSVFFDQYPQVLADSIKQLNSKQKRLYGARWKQVGKQVVTQIMQELNRYKHDNHIMPVVNTVDVLPKDELAAMAESLVNLTSLKRRFTLDAETVGGPIDVAVISKGDGFIWIKRKHYFDAALNPQFFANYNPQFTRRGEDQ